MATITCLPPEIINIILGYSDVTIEDILNFRCVCKQFQGVAKYHTHFKNKCSQRWPSAKKFYDEELKINKRNKCKKNEEKNSLKFIKTGIKCAKQLREFMSQLIYSHYHIVSNKPPPNNYKYIEMSDNFVQFFHIFYLNGNGNLEDNFLKIKYWPKYLYAFYVDELKNSIAHSSRTDYDLTKRYCNEKLFYYLRQNLVQNKQEEYTIQHLKKQLFERHATYIAQWLQPQKDIFYSSIQASLDSIAQDVLKYLREKHLDHSIFSTSAETFSYWKNNNIEDNHWNETEGIQIIDALQEYISNNVKFKLSESNNQYAEDMCIDYVLNNKCGQGFVLVLIYQSVARRLGLHCEILKTSDQPYKFCLRWKSEYVGNNSNNVRCFNEMFENLPDDVISELLHFESLDDSYSIWRNLLQITTYQKTRFMGLNFINNLYNHKDFQKSRFCLRFKKTKLFNIRSQNVKFAIGMIVKQSEVFKNFNFTGVIIGWHRPEDKHIEFVKNVSSPKLAISTNRDVLRLIMQVHRCCNYYFEKEQTNYVILTENNEMCYLGEDNITFATPKWINNNELGRYFCHFAGTHYVPNKMLASFYPQDAAVTAQKSAIISEN